MFLKKLGELKWNSNEVGRCDMQGRLDCRLESL